MPRHQRSYRALFGAIVAITTGASLHGAVINTWSGAIDANWSTVGDWNTTNAGGIPVAGDTVLMDGSTNTANNNNDLAANTSLAAINFNAGAAPFTIGGNAVTLTTGSTNSSSNLQSIGVDISAGAAITFAAGSGGMSLTGNLTDTAASGNQNWTLTGTGTLRDTLTSTAGGALVLNASAASATWTIVDNAASTAVSGNRVQLNASNGGTINFGSATSSPNLTLVALASPFSDHTIGGGTGQSNFNMVAGTLTLQSRLNTTTGNFTQTGGTVNMWNQFQMDNGALTNSSNVSISGGTLNIFNSTGGASGPIFVASRGTGVFTVSGANTFVMCSTLDVSRDITNGTKGTVNLNGGVLQVKLVTTASANSVGTNTLSSGIFNFNGGTLKSNASSMTWITHNGQNNANDTPLTLVDQAGGAIIDTNGFTDTVTLALTHDSTLGSTADGGMTKKGAGSLSMIGADTYTGPTAVTTGTLLRNGSHSNAAAYTIAGTIGGNGRINFGAGAGMTVNSTGVIAPGNPGAAPNVPIDTLTMDGLNTDSSVLTMLAGASMTMELNNSFLSDQVSLTDAAAGDVVFNNNVVNFSDLSAGTLATGQYTLIKSDAPGAYTGLTVDGGGTITSGLTIGSGLLTNYPASTLQVSGNNIVVNVAVSVPEPSMIGLGAIGICALISRRRRA